MSRILIAVLLFIWASQSVADDLRSGLSQCRGIQSLAQRLQCYDRLVDKLPEIEVTSTVAPAASDANQKTQPVVPSARPAVQQPSKPVAPVAVAPEQVKPEELFGKSDSELKEVVERKLEIASVDEISSKVVRIQISSSKEYVVYLENGQVWRQKDDAGKWRIKVGETATISKAALGSFLMKSDARKRSVRAERLK
jgi:hypothetical protein